MKITTLAYVRVLRHLAHIEDNLRSALYDVTESNYH